MEEEYFIWIKFAFSLQHIQFQETNTKREGLKPKNEKIMRRKMVQQDVPDSEPKLHPKPPVKPENNNNNKFQRGGASIVYVHTFCSELLGEGSSLEFCRYWNIDRNHLQITVNIIRSEMKTKCDMDVLSWFQISPSQSQDIQGMLSGLIVKLFFIFFYFFMQQQILRTVS